LIGLCIVFALAGCSPKYDWRQVTNPEVGWAAMFPGKPVEVTRTFTAPGVDQPVSLTLRSARIDQALFAVGWVTLTDTSTPPQPSALPKTSTTTSLVSLAAAEKIRVALENAMLANIQHAPASLERQPVQIASLRGQALKARGQMPVGSKSDMAPASLWMRSLVIASPTGVTPPFFHVVEIIAVGPDQSLAEEIAAQFVESLQPLR
jgi:hypothetical protein